MIPDQVDETYFKILQSGAGEITVEEIAELSAIFGEGGEMEAERRLRRLPAVRTRFPRS